MLWRVGVRNVYHDHVCPPGSTGWLLSQGGLITSHLFWHRASIRPPPLRLLLSPAHSATRWIFPVSYFLHTVILLRNFQWLPIDHNINQNLLGAWHSNSNITPICLMTPTAYIFYMKTFLQSNQSTPYLTHISCIFHGTWNTLPFSYI